MQLKQIRSNSWSDSLDDCRIMPALDLNRTLLGDSQKHLYDTYKRAYAEMLYRWGMLVPRSKILKYVSINLDQYRDVEFVTECQHCGRATAAPTCKDCHKPLLNCSLCRLPVRGLANACLSCGHGGHSNHMQKWFDVSNRFVEFGYADVHTFFRIPYKQLKLISKLQENEMCATGCGCFCLNYVI